MFKIVIWDLDETFWRGTLSEGEVEPIPENIELIKAFVNRGIMNSIVSKNDYDSAMKVLQEWGLDYYFIFPHISWNPKGENVQSLLEECNLRAENALFVDDNPSNLEEVKYYNPGISCEMPKYMGKHILESKEFRGKDDCNHSRLKQYRILEERIKRKNLFASNTDFLRASHIEIQICTDCIEQLERIEELIQRTNQLNYTKNRMDMAELRSLLCTEDVTAAYIKARDDFGEYGIVGFYLLKDNKLVHFLFSCRILGFGIENYIYNKLNCPNIEVKGDIVTPLTIDMEVDWIKESYDNILDYDISESENKSADGKDRLLLIGGCDLYSASRYLELDFDVRKEFNSVVNGHSIRTSDTSQLVNAKKLSAEVKKELCNNLPFMDESMTYATELYSGKYRVIIISLVDDFIRGVYRRKDSDYFVTFGNYWDPEENLGEFTEDELKYLRENFYFDGREDTSVFKSNIEKIIEGVGNSKLILINGIELDVSDWIGKDRCLRNTEMNAVIDEVIKENPQVGLIDMRKIITNRNQLIKHDNRHFDQKSYYIMTQEIIRQSIDMFQGDLIHSKSLLYAFIRDIYIKVKIKLKHIMRIGR